MIYFFAAAFNIMLALGNSAVGRQKTAAVCALSAVVIICVWVNQ